MTDLDARLQRLEDREQLRELKHRYAALCDADYDADGLAELFTADAVWDGGEVMGRHEGREAIRTFFAASSAQMPFAIHHVLNERLDVDGDRATGRWYLWQPCVFAADGESAALWMAGRYEDSYRRENAEWRFAHVKIELRMLSPYEHGWAVAPFGAVQAK